MISPYFEDEESIYDADVEDFFDDLLGDFDDDDDE